MIKRIFGIANFCFVDHRNDSEDRLQGFGGRCIFRMCVKRFGGNDVNRVLRTSRTKDRKRIAWTTGRKRNSYFPCTRGS